MFFRSLPASLRSFRCLLLAVSAGFTASVACGQGIPVISTSSLDGLVSSDSVSVTVTPATLPNLNRVRLYRNGVLFGTDTTSPYEFSLSDLRQNTYEIYARAEYNSGNFESPPLAFSVGVPPILLEVTSADTQSPGNTVLNCVPYQGSGGAVDSVVFYRNERFGNSDRTAPYVGTFNNLVSDVSQYVAEVRYRNNDTFRSNVLQLTVTPPPVALKVKSKANSRSIIATASVNSAAPGDVDSVRFSLSDGTTITDGTFPYSARFRRLEGRKYRVAITVDLDNGEDVKATSKVLRFRR